MNLVELTEYLVNTLVQTPADVALAESNEDMNRFGFLDIGEEWWI